jgi:hypothetical protein
MSFFRSRNEGDLTSTIHKEAPEGRPQLTSQCKPVQLPIHGETETILEKSIWVGLLSSNLSTTQASMHAKGYEARDSP